jgi:post-segregation antitoxin (ccd killing protein)
VKEGGISMAKLTRVSDLFDWTVRSAWKTPSYTIGVLTLAKIARALGVSVSELIEEESQEEREADTTRWESSSKSTSNLARTREFFGATFLCFSQQ